MATLHIPGVHLLLISGLCVVLPDCYTILSLSLSVDFSKVLDSEGVCVCMRLCLCVGVCVGVDLL